MSLARSLPSLAALLLALHAAPHARAADDDGLTLRAAATGLAASFDRSGLRLRPRGAARDLTLQTARVGCQGALTRVRAGALADERGRATLEHRLAGGRLSEWVVTGPGGLEHGYTVPRPLPCRARGGEGIIVEVRLAGGYRAEVSADGRGALLRGAGALVRYTDLHAVDARGRRLPARLVARSGHLQLHVDDRGAVYPITIDPLLANQEAKLAADDPALGDNFGFSVAIDGATAIAGVPFDDDNGTSSGSARVFVESGGVWSQQAKLTASDAASNDQFGYAVALVGDVAAVGAPFEVALRNVLPGSTVLWLTGFDRLPPFDLGWFGMPGCVMFVSPQLVQQWTVPGPILLVPFPIPNDVNLAGLTFYHQAAVLDRGANSAGIVLSNAGEGVVGW